MACPGCAHENPPEAKFCLRCGIRLTLSCESCRSSLPANAKFCLQCGRPVDGAARKGEPSLREGEAPAEPSGRTTGGSAGASPSQESADPRAYTPRHLVEKILTGRGAVEGERKHVTVLFADLAGYTSLAERADPEDMHALMDRCFRLILAEVHRYEGTVNQFTGDGVMALFGAPIALEDAPRRAVLAALGIQKALEPLRAEVKAQHGLDFRMRIGINSGTVVVGRIGDDLRMDYTAVGDTTNLAARLQQIARPGAVLISAPTRRLVEGYFELHTRRPVKVKGKALPIRSYEVLGERAVSGRIEAIAEGGLTPLVGRERELGTLMDAYETAHDGHGQVVFLVGDAGMGKSRLLYEFRHRLAEQRHTWFEGHCASYGSITAFHAIIDGLQRHFGIEDRDEEAARLGKIGNAIAAAGGEMDWTLPFLRVLLSLPPGDEKVAAMDGGTRRSETFRALCAYLHRLSEKSPLVLVMEDLHWIDRASEEFLGYMAETIPACQALLLFTHRPGYRQPFGDRSYHLRLPLRVLSEGDMSRMAGSLLESAEVPAELRRVIAGKAEGNPFFIEEVTRSLLEQKILKHKNGRVVLTRDVSEISIPDSIQDVLMARIDRLAEEPKRAIQIASIIGREFALRLLERISEMGDRLDHVIGDLRALELIYEKAAHPELAFMFKHALTHDVAYQSVLVKRRKALHGVVGLAMEDLYGDRLAEHYDALAHHFERAEQWEKALHYEERAGAKAAEAYANQSAAEHFRRALEIVKRLGSAVPAEGARRLEESLANACFYTSQYEAAGDAHLRAAELSEDPETRALNLAGGAHEYFWGHKQKKAEQTLARVFTIVRSGDYPAAEAKAYTMKGFFTAVVGEMNAFREHLNKAEKLGERARNEEVIALVHYMIGQHAEWTGNYRDAISYSEKALAAGRRLRLPHLVIWPNWFIGKALTCLGDYGRAFHHLSASHDLCERIGDRAWRTRLLNTLGWCFAEIGRLDLAREHNERAAVLAHEIGDPEIIANAEINLGGNFLAAGDLDAAREHLLPIWNTLDERPPFQRWRYSLHLHDALGRLALVAGDPEKTLALAEKEIERAHRHGVRKIEARALELRGRALLTIDRREEAEASLGKALEITKNIGYPPVRWRALSLLAELARRRGDRSEAERLAHAARTLVETSARSISETDLKNSLGSLAERVASDPLGAYR